MPILFVVVIGLVISGTIGIDAKTPRTQPLVAQPAPTATPAATAQPAAPGEPARPTATAVPPGAIVTPTAPATATPSSTLRLAAGALSLVSINSPVALGERVILQVKTTPEVKCDIVYQNARGRERLTEDLAPRTANSQGMITWRFGTSDTTKAGAGTAVVTCGADSITVPIETVDPS